MKNYYVCYTVVYYGITLTEIAESFPFTEINNKNIGDFKKSFEEHAKGINPSYSNVRIISWQEVREV